MEMITSFILSIDLVCCIIPLIVIYISFQEHPSKGLTFFTTAMITFAIDAVANVILSLSLDDSAALFAYKAIIISRIFAIFMVLRFVQSYFNWKINTIAFYFMFFTGIVIQIVASLTNRFPLFLKEYHLVQMNGIGYLKFTPGLFYYIYLFLIAFTLISLSIRIFMESKHIKNVRDKKRYYIIAVGIVLPLIGSIVNFLTPHHHYFDYNSLSLSGTCICFFIAMRRYGIFDIEQDAKEYVLDHMVEAVMIVDTNKNILYMNDIVQKLNENLALYKPMDPAFEFLLDTNNHEYSLLGMNFEYDCTPLVHEDNTISGYLIEVRNVTENRQKTVHMQQLNKEAEIANQAKSTFISTMSHEIRTPINAVLGMDEMILRESEDTTVLEYAENIKNAGNSLLAIINDILDFSKIETGELEISPSCYELIFLIENAKRMVMPRLEGKAITLNFHINEKLPKTLLGDGNRISQAMINYLTNAAKYTEKGSIEVTLDMEKSDQLDSNEIYLCYSVKDTGCGIKEEDLKKLFTSFTRVDEDKNRNVEGTGLGLVITQKLIQKMNGIIDVKSTYGVGSTFSFKVPQIVIDSTSIGKVEKEHAPKKKKYQESFHAPNAKILVVDDNAVNIKVLEGLLKKTWVQITSVKSGMECIEKVKKNQFDLIFMDHMMPEMDGIETLKYLKTMEEFHPENTPVIALTANAINGVREMYLQEGFSDYLTKPVNSKELERLMIFHLSNDLIEVLDVSETE